MKMKEIFNLHQNFYNDTTKIYDVLDSILIDNTNEELFLEKLYNIPDGNEWDKKLLIGILKGVILLIWRKNISDIITIIEKLREEQAQYEETYLNQFTSDERPYKSAEIISLYYVCKIIELLSDYLMSTGNSIIGDKINQFIYKAYQFAIASKNESLENFIYCLNNFVNDFINRKEV